MFDYYNEKGQEDVRKGEYNRPHRTLDVMTTRIHDKEAAFSENKSYDLGWSFGKGGLDKEHGNYNPPLDPEMKKAYDVAWEIRKDSVSEY